MAQKTLIDKTIYEVNGAKTLVDGTIHDIIYGKTLVDGTAFAIEFNKFLHFGELTLTKPNILTPPMTMAWVDELPFAEIDSCNTLLVDSNVYGLYFVPDKSGTTGTFYIVGSEDNTTAEYPFRISYGGLTSSGHYFSIYAYAEGTHNISIGITG